MRLSAADVTAHPVFAAYVRLKIPELRTVPVVIRNLARENTLSSAEVHHALLWNQDPLIQILDLSGGQCGGVVAVGCTRDTTHIEIDTAVVEEFERGGAAGLRPNTAGKGVYLAGVTLLHELCHWGRRVKGSPQPYEVGLAYETATYGKIIN